jgi:malate synthase
MNTTIVLKLPSGVTLRGPLGPGFEAILTEPALELVALLHRALNADRLNALRARAHVQARLDAGESPVRVCSGPAHQGNWKVRPAPADLNDRRVEITGPVDRKMIINALNSGARCFMADFEDASAPSWTNMIEGQINLRDANRRTITFADDARGKSYALGNNPATLIVRPRGWHLNEAHLEVDGEAVSGSLFDFALYLFHNYAALSALGSGPYFYFPKLETPEEAGLWARAITLAENHLGLPRGTVRCTVLIETIMASFVLDEILYELRDWITALNCGRWDYIFSYIKRFRNDPGRILPDRAQVTMSVPFMRAYSQLVIAACHKRGAHAMGGMSAFIPVKDDEAANALAFSKLDADKRREAGDGHDGTWVAHPGMVSAAMAVFDELMPGANQLGKHPDVTTITDDMLTAPCQGTITLSGVRANIEVGIAYIAAWLTGQGAVPIHNLMEDAATAEISRAQLWQWRVHSAKLATGETITDDWLSAEFDGVERVMKSSLPGGWTPHHDQAMRLMRDLVFNDHFSEFLTLPAYERIKTLNI